MRPNFYQRRLRPNFGISGKSFVRLILISIVILSVYTCYNIIFRSVSVYRANRYQESAEALIKQNQNAEALINVKKALFLVPDHIKSCRLMAYLLCEQGDSRALEYYRLIVLKDAILPGEIQISEVSSDFGSFFDGGGDVIRGGDTFLGIKEKAELLPHATREDVNNFAMCAVKYGKNNTALDIANLLSSKWKSDFYPHLVKASIEAKKGDFASQELELRTALQKAENLETLTALFQFLLSRSRENPENSQEMVLLLGKITRLDSSPHSLSLCVKLLSEGSLNKEFVPTTLEILRHHPAAGSETLLFADKYQLSIQPDQRSQILENVVRRTQSLPLLERPQAITWLMSIEEPTKAQLLLSFAESNASPELFEIWVRSAIALKQWSSLDKALSSSSTPLPSHRIQYLEAVVAGLKGDASKSRKMLDELFIKNQKQPDILFDLVVSLACSGEWKILYSQLPLLLSNPSWSLKTVDTLVPIIRQHGDSSLMLDFYEHALKSSFLVNQPHLLDCANYTRLVLGQSVSVGKMEALYKKNPENISCRVTYALSLLKSGTKVKSLYVLRDLEPKIQVDALPPQQRAVYSLILAANGLSDEAQAIVKTIPAGCLTRQEEALLQMSKNPSKPD